jgi:predicted transcriptional regulator
MKLTHRILHLDVLGPDGVRSSDHVVFCRLQSQTVRVEQCCQCVHCDAIEEKPAAAVVCTIPSTPLAPADDPRGERIEVASLLQRGAVVVSESVPLGTALSVMHAEDRRAIAIVDGDHVMIGLVHDSDCRLRWRTAHGTVTAAMSTALAVDEHTPVRVALRLLAANHLREAIVVTKRGVPLGVFRDVDGLDWISAAHRARPDGER